LLPHNKVGVSIMWGTLFKQATRLAQEGYSREEVREILKRAAELQAQAERRQEQVGEGQIRRDALRAGAMAAGIKPEFLEQALQEFHAKNREQKRESKREEAKWGKLVGWILAGILGLPIAIFVLGVLAFTFGTVISVLLAVGLALGIAGLALLLVSPFAGFGLLIGLAVALGQFLGRAKSKHGKRWKRHWHRWFDDDDD
jgi:ABC-type nickel/cobalt efflux system permease component RcnA